MGAQDWPVGQLAVATVCGVGEVTALWCGGKDSDGREVKHFWCTPEHAGGSRFHNDDEVTVIRPLVVLDINRPTAEDVCRVLREGGYGNFADQIEAQTRPPKPAEPTGLGAVVRARDGLLWQRIDADPPWFHRDVFDKAWDQIDVAEVLSEGVQP